MSMKKNIALLAAFAMMGGLSANSQDIEIDNVGIKPQNTPIPKGAKEYWFNENGGFSTEKMRRDEIVFKCIAINDKSAKKKFEKWKLTNAI